MIAHFYVLYILYCDIIEPLDMCILDGPLCRRSEMLSTLSSYNYFLLKKKNKNTHSLD